MLTCLVTTTNTLKMRLSICLVNSKQLKKERAEVLLLKLMAGCHAIGKLRLKLRQIKVKKALRILAKIVPYIGRFLATRRKQYAEVITFMVERSLTKGMLMRMMLTWKQKVGPK